MIIALPVLSQEGSNQPSFVLRWTRNSTSMTNTPNSWQCYTKNCTGPMSVKHLRTQHLLTASSTPAAASRNAEGICAMPGISLNPNYFWLDASYGRNVLETLSSRIQPCYVFKLLCAGQTERGTQDLKSEGWRPEVLLSTAARVQAQNQCFPPEL